MRMVRILLALALLGGLAWAGARIYRDLPSASSAKGNVRAGAPQDLTIVLHVQGSGETHIKLYPIDFAALERDYANAPRPGKTFEDFLAARLKDLTPVTASADANGRAVAHVSEGNWWMHAVAAFPDGEWQQVNIAERPQTIELTSANAYQRSKKF